MRGKNAKARAGKVVSGTLSPYGYAFANGELTINESQAQIVRMIFDWYINGDEHGGMMSFVTIAKRLTDMGIPTPTQSKSVKYKQPRRGFWYRSSVNNIICSETYAGVLRYGKQRPVNEQIAVNVPAIVSRETWELAQARRAYNRKIAKRKMKREYLLRGIIFCGCGRRLTGTDGDYRCWRRYGVNGETCAEPLVKGKVIESVTWDYIMGLITDTEEFEQKLRQAQAQEATTMQPKQKELEHVIALLKETEKEAEEIARATPKAKGIIAAKLEQQADEVNRRYQALTKRKAELQEALTFELTEGNINNLLEFREAVAVGLENPTNEDRRRWLEILQATVTVTNGIAVVTCRLSNEPFTYPLFENSIS
jgi:site-specific DNA recombinase